MQRYTRSILSLVLVMILAVAGAVAQEGSGELPDLKETGVVVPWSDFKILLEDLKRIPQPTPIPPPPVDHAFSECRITAVADREEKRMVVDMDFTVQVLEDKEWVEIQVAPVELALDRVRMNGVPARLYRKGRFQCVAVQGRGQHQFNLRAVVPVVRLRGQWSASLRYPPAPVASLEVEVPGEDRVIEVEGGVVGASGFTGEAAHLAAALTGNGAATVSWYRKTPEEQRESTVFADVSTLFSIGEGILRGHSVVNYTIHGQGVTQFLLDAPADVTVIDVRGQGLAEWKVSAADEARQKVSVLPAFPAEGSFSFEVEMERALESAQGGEFNLPDIVVEGVRRERGYLAISAATNVEIRPGESFTNAAAVDPSEMPAVLAARAGAEVLYLFKYLRHPVVIPVSVTKHEDLLVKRTIVESARLATFVNPLGRRLSSAVYRIKNNRKQFLAVELPEGATLWGAFLEGRPVKAALREDGAVLVPLKKTALGPGAELRPFDLEVTWYEEGRRAVGIGGLSFDAPALDVDCLDLEWTVFLPRESRYLAFGGDLKPDPMGDLQVVAGELYRRGDDVARPAGKVSALDEDKVDEIGRQEAEEYPGRMLSQVAQSNVAMMDSSAILGGAGRARGVLPVRVSIPEVGFELGFSGKLIVAGEAQGMTMVLIPASWRGPRLGRSGTALLAFFLTLAGGLAIVTGAVRRNLWVGIACVLLFLLYLAAVNHFGALFIGLTFGAAVVWIVRWFRNREPEIEDGF